jgi:DNA-binding NtrC family response regulator
MNQERIRLLLIEDVATDAEVEVRELKRAGMSVEHRRVETEDAFRAELESFSPHVIISDFSMPHFDGMAALALARELCPDTPFLLVSGTIGEEYAIRALKSGATDYVLKGNLVRLPAAIERALQDADSRRAHREAERQLAATRERLQTRSGRSSCPNGAWLTSARPQTRSTAMHRPPSWKTRSSGSKRSIPRTGRRFSTPGRG